MTDPLGLLWPDAPADGADGPKVKVAQLSRWAVPGPIAVIVLLAVVSQFTLPATTLVMAVAGVCLVVVLHFGDPAAARPVACRTASVLAVLATSAACGVLALPEVKDVINGHAVVGDDPSLVRPVSVAWLRRTRDLRGRDLRGRTLNGIDLRGRDLSNADLRGASLRGAMLARADLSGAKVIGTDFSGADLSDACLVNVALTGAITTGAVTTGAVTTGTISGSPSLTPVGTRPAGSAPSPCVR